ncbi:MAG: MBOAT family protein [Bacteroidia bacterium]|nr:MBOAT family protein [Bacteroidia bacterium]
MVFNSLAFITFLLVVFAIYWLLKARGVNAQNNFLLLASYFFYAWWDWRFLSLLIAQSVISFYIAKKIETSLSFKKSKTLMFIGVSIVLLVLMFFKYFNFFSQSFTDLFTAIGFKTNPFILKLVLPLGISFFTFKIIAYLLDVYRKNISAENNLFNYLLFVSFFPQLVAGPIERAQTLLPQIKQQRVFGYAQAVLGLRLILWGMFKKVVVADNCAVYVSDIFGHAALYNSSTLFLGAVYFAFQVYADFSGYTDIAIGSGKLLGFNLMANFDYPFSSKNITEFWRRWHISLGSWFNDYVFMPMYSAYRDYGNAAMYASILITFLLSGLWHGASWHFVFFGFLHGLSIAIETALKKQRKKWSKQLGVFLYNKTSVAATFLFLLLSWIYFRSDDMPTANQYLARLFTKSFFEVPQKLAYIPFFTGMIVLEYWQRNTEHPIAFPKLPKVLRWCVYVLLLFVTIYYFGKEQAFYYFKF